MKALLLINFLIVFTSGQVLGQSHAPPAKYANIFGRWYYYGYEKEKKLITFNKKESNSFQYGKYIEFRNQNKFVYGRNAQCGNDQNIFRKTGLWEIDYQLNILRTNIMIMDYGKIFRIKDISQTNLYLEIYSE